MLSLQKKGLLSCLEMFRCFFNGYTAIGYRDHDSTLVGILWESRS